MLECTGAAEKLRKIFMFLNGNKWNAKSALFHTNIFFFNKNILFTYTYISVSYSVQWCVKIFGTTPPETLLLYFIYIFLMYNSITTVLTNTHEFIWTFFFKLTLKRGVFLVEEKRWVESCASYPYLVSDSFRLS